MAKRSVWLLGLISVALFASAAHAQYKWIDADGRIGYGDRLPPRNVKVLQSPTKKSVSAARSGPINISGDLPYTLRNPVRSAPVTLYTSTNCDPCDLARDHLRKRGVPFSEKIVSSARDVEAFRNLGFPTDSGLPVVTAGTNRQIGYHGARWDDLLNQAGYPKKSVLPNNFQMPAPQSLASASQPVNQTAPEAIRRGNVLARERKSPYGQGAPEARVRF